MTTDTYSVGTTLLHGLTFQETGGASATISFSDSDDGEVLWTRNLNAGEGDKVKWSSPRLLTGGLTVVTTGTVTYGVNADATGVVPPDLIDPGGGVFQDVAWGTASNNETADVLIPSGAGPFPVVFLMHGGGFVVGDKAAMYSMPFSGNLPLAFAQAGYVCVNLNYPLSRFPATNVYGTVGTNSPEARVQVAIAYFRTNAATYNINANKVAVTGGSAGGSYALYTAAALEAQTYMKSVIAFSPGTDYRIDEDRNPATETYGEYLTRLHSEDIHAFEVVEHMGLAGIADDGTGLNQGNASCASSCAHASPVVKVASTTTQTKTHVFVSSDEIIPATVVAQYVDAADTAGVDYTFDVNGVVSGALDTTITTTLGLTYTNFNTTDSTVHADYPGAAERYLDYLAADFA